MELKDVFIAKARKYNQYFQCNKVVQDRKCINCQRWRFSYPYTCNDYDMYGTKAEGCINYTEDKHCKVD